MSKIQFSILILVMVALSAVYFYANRYEYYYCYRGAGNLRICETVRVNRFTGTEGCKRFADSKWEEVKESTGN